MAESSDPLGDSEGMLGSNSIESPPPIAFDGSTEKEIALAISRAVDSLAALTKFLPLPPAAVATFRDSMFSAWSMLLLDIDNCRDESPGMNQPEFPES